MQTFNLGILCNMTNKSLISYSAFKKHVLKWILKKNIKVKTFVTGGYKHNYTWVTRLAKELGKPCKCFHQRDKLATILFQVGNKAHMILYL